MVKRYTVTRQRSALISLLIILLLLASWPPASLAQEGAAEKLDVFIRLRLPDVSALGTSVKVVQTAQAQGAVLSSLPAEEFQVEHRYTTIPAMSGEVTAQGLEKLHENPYVAGVGEVRRLGLQLSESSRFIGADRVWNELGYTGRGVNVAVIDTGIDSGQEDLADSIVAQHCFAHGNCPPGGSDESESAPDEHGHGTHVAGIITSNGSTAPRGIAPDAGIVAVRIFSGGAYPTARDDDIIAAIDWVTANKEQLNVRVINLSLGSEQLFGSECDNASETLRGYAEVINRARLAGIIVFAASGNNGDVSQIAYPACLSGVVSVGSVYDSEGSFQNSVCSDTMSPDKVSCFSNGGPLLDLLAPGVKIKSTARSNGAVELSGTSMSAPHASALAALLLEADSSLTPEQIKTTLRQTGVAVASPSALHPQTPRIDAYAALDAIRPAGLVVRLTGPAQAKAGDSFKVSVVAGDVGQPGIFGGQFSLTFDPQYLEASNLQGDSRMPFVVARNVDNAVGRVTFAASRQGDVENLVGGVTLATLDFRARQPTASTTISLEEVKLGTKGGTWVATDEIRDLALGIEPGAEVAVTGQVRLEGRRESEWGNALVVVGGTLHQALTEADGNFGLLVQQGSYDLEANADGYLAAVCENRTLSAPQTALAPVQLLAGDINDDGAIDILDATRLGLDFGRAGPQLAADLNGDGEVDIIDLVLMAANYGAATTEWDC
jgi:subtilisin family serine protease